MTNCVERLYLTMRLINDYRLLTEYEFVAMQKTKINACLMQYIHMLSHCHVKKNQKDKCTDFCHLHYNKIISVI